MKKEGILGGEKMESLVEGCYGERKGVRGVLGDMWVVRGMDEGGKMIDMEKVEMRMVVRNIVKEV